jgi:hypothetical protein
MTLMLQELLLQEFLRNNSPEKLDALYFISSKQHKKYPNLYLFKYDQIRSNMRDPLVQECRGIILDRDDDWKIVAYPYNKFFNYGEAGAAEIDWRTAKVYEKLDGSLCTLYYYDDKWHVATSGTPDASGEVNGFGFTFEELFWRVWNKLGYMFPPSFSDSRFTYMFELMTSFNRIIVRHPAERLVLHGTRNIDNLTEYKPEDFARVYGWECVKNFSLVSIKDIISSLQLMNPMEQEGYIVVDDDFNRIKVKSPQYVALHHMTDGMSTRRMLEIVRTNEGSEFLSYFPEWENVYKEVKDKYFALLIEVNQCYNMYKGIANQKDFALAVKELPYSGALFNMRSGKIQTFEEFFKSIPIKNLESMLNLKVKELVSNG